MTLIELRATTKEDIEQQKKIDAYNEVITKARAVGLSKQDLATLKGGAA